MGCHMLEGEAGWYCGIVIAASSRGAEIHTSLP